MIPPSAVLAAVDFSDPSATALDVAARLARQAGAALHVLYAEDPLLAEAARQAGTDLAQDSAAELSRFTAPVLAARPVPVDHTVAVGPAVDVILAHAARVRADVIVIGSHGMSGAERLMFGSTTEGVLRRATVSVLVTPPAWRSTALDAVTLAGAGPVLAGIDLGDSSASTLAAACRLAALAGTSVEAIHVVPDPPVLARLRRHADAVTRDRIASAREALDRLVAGTSCAAPLQVRVETGGVAECLAGTAAALSDRLPILVLGRQTRDAKTGPPGAIAYRTLSLARVPVVMHVASD